MNLFKKNIFSTSSPTFSKLADSETGDLISIINKYYPTLQVKEIHQIGAFELNSNNWKIVTNQEEYILKRASLEKQEALKSQAQWTSELSSTGFPTLHFLKNNSDKIISIDTKYIYCMTIFKSGDYFGTTLNEWTDLILHLKRMYDYTLKTKQSPALSKRLFFTEEENALIQKISPQGQIKQQNIETIVLEYEKMKLFYDQHKHQYNTGVFHVDIHPHNLIFNNNKLILLTDFEAFLTTTVEISLGFGLYKCARQLLAINESNTQKEIIEIVHKLRTLFEFHFPENNFKNLLVSAKIDVLKRLLYILGELSEKGESKWLFIFQTQLDSLEEINQLEKILI